jgi:hypothetical protein
VQPQQRFVFLAIHPTMDIQDPCPYIVLNQYLFVSDTLAWSWSQIDTRQCGGPGCVAHNCEVSDGEIVL